MCTRRSAPALADPRSKSASREPSRAPCREAVDHRSGTRGSVEVVQRDDPLEAGLQVAILPEHPGDPPDGWPARSGRSRGGPHCRVPERRRGRLWLTDGSCIRLRPLYRHHVWAYDFVADRTHDGRPLKMLTVLDEYSRECLAIVVARRLRADDVLQTLSELFVEQYPNVHTNVHTFPRGEGLRPLPFSTIRRCRGVRPTAARSRSSLGGNG